MPVQEPRARAMQEYRMKSARAEVKGATLASVHDAQPTGLAAVKLVVVDGQRDGSAGCPCQVIGVDTQGVTKAASPATVLVLLLTIEGALCKKNLAHIS